MVSLHPGIFIENWNGGCNKILGPPSHNSPPFPLPPVFPSLSSPSPPFPYPLPFP